MPTPGIWRITRGDARRLWVALGWHASICLGAAILLLVATLAAGCGSGDTGSGGAAADPSVIASFYPLAEFSRSVAGISAPTSPLEGRLSPTDVTVTSITPAGVEPHDFEPSPRQLGEIERADLFIYNGGGLDPWAARFADSLSGTDTESLDISKVIPKSSSQKADDLDPHFWLNPLHAKTITRKISDRLSAIDPAQAQSFRTNQRAYEQELGKLDKEFASGLSECRSRTIVTTHNAFGYLAERYDFEIISIAGLSPEDDPSPRRMAEIARTLKQEEIGTIFFETLTSPKFAKTLAGETGAKVAVLDPIEGVSEKDRAAGKDYLSIMRDNLAALRLAMGCE